MPKVNGSGYIIVVQRICKVGIRPSFHEMEEALIQRGSPDRGGENGIMAPVWYKSGGCRPEKHHSNFWSKRHHIPLLPPLSTMNTSAAFLLVSLKYFQVVRYLIHIPVLSFPSSSLRQSQWPRLHTSTRIHTVRVCFGTSNIKVTVFKSWDAFS